MRTRPRRGKPYCEFDLPLDQDRSRYGETRRLKKATANRRRPDRMAFDARLAHHTVELHVRMPAYDDVRLRSTQDGGEDGCIRRHRENFVLAARCCVTEKNVAQSFYSETNGLWPTCDETPCVFVHLLGIPLDGGSMRFRNSAVVRKRNVAIAKKERYRQLLAAKKL